MFCKTISNPSRGWLAYLAVAVFAAVLTPAVSAEETETTVEISAAQLTEIQSELQFLRQKEEQRSSRENTLARLASFRKNQCDDVCDSPDCGPSCDTCNASNSCDACDACRMAGCDSQGRGICPCLCHGCVRPICAAPCIDCPRVSTASPYFNINLYGALKLDMLFNRPRTFAQGVPFFLAPASPRGFSQDNVSIHARQSMFGAQFTGPQFGGFQSGGQAAAMFFNDSVTNDTYGFLPLQAYGELKNDRWRFAAGLQFDVFAPGIPTVLPFSALGASGNTGNSFRGQLRVERFFKPSSDVQWTAQFALSEPITTTIDSAFRLLEDNGWPNVEGRLALGLGCTSGPAGRRPFEMGLSGVVGEMRNTPPAPAPRLVTDVWGAAVDLRWAVSDNWGLLGEVFSGKALGTYNAGVLQNINVETQDGIQTSGGFVETYVYLSPRLHTHIGYGIDDPKDEDVANAAASLGITRNQTVYTNFLWDVNQTFRIGLEFAYRDTDYKSPFVLDNQGLGVHTQFQWLF